MPLVVAHVGRNDFVGEIAILCDVPRTASVVARTDLTTLCISKDLFFRMVTEFPADGGRDHARAGAAAGEYDPAIAGSGFRRQAGVTDIVDSISWIFEEGVS